MELDPRVCYRALTSRDPRFDGRFFTAVLTTGIYCRPICPAPMPRRVNLRYYRCAAAAEEVGYRPCRRCRPECSPGTPEWAGPSSIVARAHRLIGEGFLDGGSIETLAERVGIGPRQLRRLFREHLGASPVAIAQTRRIHFARKLIDETRLPMIEVAFEAGFASVRRFNAALKAAYARTPTELRRLSSRPNGIGGASALQLRLPYRPPLDWDSLISFLGPRATPGVEEVVGGAYRRTISLGECRGIIEVRPSKDGNCLLLAIRAEVAQELLQVSERARRLFDLRADPHGIAAHLRRDPLLAPVVEASPGMRVPGAWDGFEVAVRAILGQQVSVKAATTLAGRLAEAHGEPLGGRAEPPLSRLFPVPEALADADLSAIGLPGARAKAIRNLATAVRDGAVAFDGAEGLEAFHDGIRALPGVGRWTAQYIAMRALGDPDAFPADDLGLRKAVSRSSTPVSRGGLATLAEAWRPWRAYAAMYLWRSCGTRG
ncbi:MAG: AlkA N-terminal domain-containing protein [Planctomycetota bacterium]